MSILYEAKKKRNGHIFPLILILILYSITVVDNLWKEIPYTMPFAIQRGIFLNIRDTIGELCIHSNPVFEVRCSFSSGDNIADCTFTTTTKKKYFGVGTWCSIWLAHSLDTLVLRLEEDGMRKNN